MAIETPETEGREQVRSLTVGEVARIMGVHPVTVRDWLQRGTLKGIKFGTSRQTRWRIPASALDEFRAP